MNVRKIIPAAMLMGIVSFACHSSDTKENTNDTTGVISRDSVNTGIRSTDSATIGTDTTTIIRKDSTARRTKKSVAKNGKKGSISIKTYTSTDRAMMDDEGIYSRADVMPAFPGGENALRKYIEDNIEYPQDALDNDVEGTVIVTFAVDEKGKVYTPKVISNRIGYGLEDEAVKVVNNMPWWNPGSIKGKNVKTRFTLPINYQLN